MKSNLMVMNLPVAQVEPNPKNPRKDLGDLTELTESIRNNGIMQNLTVFPLDESWSRFRILIGHRRFEAAKRAGFTEVPCRVLSSEPDEKDQIAVMLEENMQRNDLTIPEQAQGFQLMLDLGYTPEEISKKTGFSETTVYHRLNIAKLDQKILSDKRDFQLSITDFIRMEAIKSIDTRNRILKEAYNAENLKYRISQAIDAEKAAEDRKTVRDYLEAKGLHEVPAEIREKFGKEWTYSIIENLDIKNYKDKKIDVTGGGIYFMTSFLYGYIYSVIRIKKQEVKPVEAKKTREELNREYLQKLHNGLMNEIREFLVYLLEDENAPKVKDGAHTERLMKRAMRTTCIDYKYFAGIITGQNYWGLKTEEIEAVSKKLDEKAHVHYLALLGLFKALKETGVQTWDLQYKDEAGKDAVMLATELSVYGLSISEEEWQYLNGSHRFYK